MAFVEFNKAWVDNLIDIKEFIIDQNAIENVKDFLRNYGAKFPILPIPLLMEKSAYENLCQTSKLLIQAQTRILNYLLTTHSQDQILELFDLPSSAKAFIDWDELKVGNKILARPDIIPSNQGYKFCELNVDSSLGGVKFFDCFSEYCDILGLNPNGYTSPRKNIANYLHELVLKHKFERVLIFSLKKYLIEGSGTVKSLFETINETISEVPISIVDEDSYPEELLNPHDGKKTLIYRLALYDDLNCHSLFLKIFMSGATMINTFETEIRSNKKWFALFHNAQYQSLLSEPERLAVLEYTPHTVSISPENIDYLIENKDHYVFKANRSYGGVAVFIGSEHHADALRKILENIKGCTAQQYIGSQTLGLPENDAFEIKSNKIVLGLFQILDQFSGIVVRGSTQNNIVNVTHGAKIGWAFPTTLSERENLMISLGKKSGFQGK